MNCNTTHYRANSSSVPGDPTGELRRLWPRALETELLLELVARTRPRERRSLRFFGIGESAVAKVFDDAGGDGDGVEATICARDFEVHVDLFVDPAGEARATRLEHAFEAGLGEFLFARDERPIEEIVLDLCLERRVRVACAESCTGGLVSASLTSIPGSSAAVLGGIVAYADAVKHDLVGVPEELLAAHGAVSAEVAQALAEGVRARAGADVGIGVTGIAGPDGGTEEKPVGLVYVHASAPWGDEALRLQGRSDRETIRRRAAKSALHVARRLLEQNRHSSV